MEAEGWFEDPFRLHAARWFSDGRPTALVRDGETESRDDPPSDCFDGLPVPIETSEAENSDDLIRADSDEVPIGSVDFGRKAWDAFDASSHGDSLM